LSDEAVVIGAGHGLRIGQEILADRRADFDQAVDVGQDCAAFVWQGLISLLPVRQR